MPALPQPVDDPAAAGQLTPVWFYLPEIAVGMLCRREQRLEPRFLVSDQQTGGEYPSGRPRRSFNRRLGDPGGQPFMHGDVVQITKTILHVLQRRQEGFATLFLLFPG